ncbi:iron-sulfur cluster scaffold-like protein [Thermogymnomonas acidicola]|uniref:Iron-sulfur cluster scaffold-like protein n=1 Tax=Thermogymnomonas acidicola TaxID=399579 RepID=A0AA37BPG9_9ARCH|nr:SUF system NifU family Fe-S cluster assembly protein [Thermogymnomonas acidicola]GGM66722.1 iron-sulfur cluster scaffold-like protein [Thermogymnomonas acidicola]
MRDEDEAIEIILDHYRSPHNYGEIESPDDQILEYNPVCGDAVRLTVRFQGDVLSDIKFVGRGCSISQASASILTDTVKGKTVSEISRITEEDILRNLGVSLGPNREKCALLAYNALQKIIRRRKG